MNFDLVILGAGESGTGAALLAQAKGLRVFVSDMGTIGTAFKADLDKAGIPFEEGTHTEELVLSAREVVKSPGIPEKAPLVKKLREKGIPVIDELEFAARYTKARFIGITGSNGKTTTTLLTYHLLKSAGLSVGLAGNVGFSLARQVMVDAFDWYVVEISSFQLDGMYRFRCDIAILTNITPDHLDRYEYQFQNYIDSKFRILQNLGLSDSLIVSAKDQVVMAELARRSPECRLVSVGLQESAESKVFAKGSQLVFNHLMPAFSLDQSLLTIRGEHNLLNAMMAVSAASLAGVQADSLRKGLATFENAPHRCEPVGEIRGIRFVNDSKATNVDSVKHAFSAFEAPVCWIAGGVDKGNDYSELDEAVKAKVRVLICLGTDNEKLKSHFKGMVSTMLETTSVTELIELVLAHAEPGFTALLSPACASFDLFKNYEDRGNQFRAAVQTKQKAEPSTHQTPQVL